MPREPSTEFDFAAVEAALDGPPDPARARELALGRLVLDSLLDALIGARLSQKELATRALALAVVMGHWRVRTKSGRDLARSIGISHTALARRLRRLPFPFNRQPKVATAPRGKAARKCSKRRQG